MEAWRRVEVAALRGDGRADRGRARGDPRRDVHRRGGPGARDRSPTTTSRRSSTCSARAPGDAGRWIHFGLTSSDVLDTALGAAAARGRARSSSRGARELRRARSPSARASTSTRSASGARTACTPSRRRSAIKLAGFAMEAHRNAERLERAFAQASVGAISRRGRHVRGDLARTFEERVLDAARPGARAGLDAGRRRATATPSCCRRSRWPAPASSASPPRSATSSAPRCARSRSRSAPGSRRARARCRTSATRSRPSASPAWRACCAATRRPASRTSRCGTSATSRTPAPSA